MVVCVVEHDGLLPNNQVGVHHPRRNVRHELDHQRATRHEEHVVEAAAMRSYDDFGIAKEVYEISDVGIQAMVESYKLQWSAVALLVLLLVIVVLIDEVFYSFKQLFLIVHVSATVEVVAMASPKVYNVASLVKGLILYLKEVSHPLP